MPWLDDIVWMRATLTGWIARHRDGRYEPFNTASMPPIPSDAAVPSGVSSGHVCYLLLDTSMRCLGQNAHGEIGNGGSSYPERVAEPWDPGLCGVRSVLTGGSHTCAVLADRRVWCWGADGPVGAPPTARCVGILGAVDCVTPPALVEGIDQIFTRALSTCAIREDRSVWC